MDSSSRSRGRARRVACRLLRTCVHVERECALSRLDDRRCLAHVSRFRDVRARPVMMNSAIGETLSRASTPTMKYLLFSATHVSGPGATTRSPGSSLPNAVPFEPLRVTSYAKLRLRWSSMESASYDDNVGAKFARMNPFCDSGPRTCASTRTRKLSGWMK